jgi:hypothetical protein
MTGATSAGWRTICPAGHSGCRRGGRPGVGERKEGPRVSFVSGVAGAGRQGTAAVCDMARSLSEMVTGDAPLRA